MCINWSYRLAPQQSAEASPEEAEEVTEESGQDGAGREAMEVEDAAASPEPALNVPPETTPPKPAAVECSETSVMEEASQNETSTDDKLPTDLAPEPTAVAMGDRTEAVERPETQVAEEVSRNETSTGDKLPVELAPAASIPEPTTVATGDRTKVPAPEEKAHQAPPSKEEERNAVAELPPVSSSGHTHFRAGAPPRDSGAGEVGVVRRSPTRRPIGPQPANLASGPIGPQPTNLVSGKASAAAPVEGKAGKKKKKKRRRRRHQQVDLGALAPSTTSAARDVEIEWVAIINFGLLLSFSPSLPPPLLLSPVSFPPSLPSPPSLPPSLQIRPGGHPPAHRRTLSAVPQNL